LCTNIQIFRDEKQHQNQNLYKLEKLCWWKLIFWEPLENQFQSMAAGHHELFKKSKGFE
jgi:hypothetical protein